MQAIRIQLQKKNLGMDGLGPFGKTWTKGTEVAEKAWCVLEVKDSTSTYLVLGSEL